MSKKDAKVSEAQLPPPPFVTEFIKTLKEWKDKKQDAPARSKRELAYMMLQNM